MHIARHRWTASAPAGPAALPLTLCPDRVPRCFTASDTTPLVRPPQLFASRALPSAAQKQHAICFYTIASCQLLAIGTLPSAKSTCIYERAAHNWPSICTPFSRPECAILPVAAEKNVEKQHKMAWRGSRGLTRLFTKISMSIQISQTWKVDNKKRTYESSGEEVATRAWTRDDVISMSRCHHFVMMSQ